MNRTNTHLILCRLMAAVAIAGTTFAADPGPPDPTAELASFELAPGFEVNLFASEREGVVKPIQMRFDPRGRLWVIGSSVYPLIEPGQTPNDKVIILEDTDRDGRADKTTVFADGLMIPTGLELVQGGAYIGHGTELLLLLDHDGDDRADERRVVLRGFGTGDNHQNINSFLWGPGGELWMCQGLHNHSNVQTPWGVVRLEQAGIWRFSPRRMKLEGFFGHEHEPQNPWGFVFTDWGEPLELAGNNSSIIYPVPGLVPNRRSERPTLIWPTGGGRKMSGGEIVGTAHFPPEWQRALVVGGYINNAVWAMNIHDDGAGFRLTDREPLLRSRSRSFRPVDVKFGPDGALYVCDWFNPIIGHYQASFRHPDRDKAHGRIWRITAKNRPLIQPPGLSDADVPELLGKLDSPDRWTRHFAKRVLADRPKGEVMAAINAWFQRGGQSDLALKESLGVLQSHEEVHEPLLARVARSTEPGARAYAAGVAGLWADRLRAPLELLRPLATDAHPRVRLQAVVASAYVRNVRALEIVLAAKNHPRDVFLDYAFRQVVHSLKPLWLPELAGLGLGTVGFDDRVWLVSTDGGADALGLVREAVRGGRAGDKERPELLRILAELGNASDLETVLNLPDEEQVRRLLPWVAENVRLRRPAASENHIAALHRLLRSKSDQVRVAASEVTGGWRLTNSQPALTEVARNPNDNSGVRRAALRALGKLGDDASRGVLRELSSGNPLDIQVTAVAALAANDLAASADLAVPLFASDLRDLQTHELLSAFLEERGGAVALSAALQKTRPAARVAAAAWSFLSGSGRHEPELLAVFRASAGHPAAPVPRTLDNVERLVGQVRQRGDEARGRQVYERPELGCVACHILGATGGNIGPNLSTLGTAQPLDFIIGAILDPQKEVKEGYAAVAVTTRDGEDYQGYLVGETTGDITLRDTLRQREVRLARGTIGQRRSIGSVMPAGLTDTLSDQEFFDLVKFLSVQGRP